MEDERHVTGKRVASRGNGQRLTRRRIPLSCVSCRTRKLKCNREKPCQNCVVRGETDASSCTYAEKVPKKNVSTTRRSEAETMRKRINRLENSILSMIEPREESEGSPGGEVCGLARQAGGQKISVDTRSTHWDAILNELGAMKDAWSAENDRIDYTDMNNQKFRTQKLGLLSGLGELPDHETILSTLPFPEAGRKLVARFFSSYNPANPAQFAFHRPTFLKQSEKHWEDPLQTKIIWIGLLYGVLCHAMQSYGPSNDVPEEYVKNYLELADLYRIRCAQCITIADITKPVDFMIEALLLYAMSEYSNQSDGDMGTWLISGTVVRLAFQQGYHRDPSEHSGISAFQGEMRRRLWHLVESHDLIFSALVGLPTAVKTIEYDTLPISNLYEEELYEEMLMLPPSRPLSELTPVSYQIVKFRIMNGYAQVLEFLHTLRPQPYEDVLRLDHVLKQGRDEIPEHLQLRTLEDMRLDPPFRVMEKYILQHFFHKSTCVLHRKFWDVQSTSANDSTIYYSRRACVSSALVILQQQISLHRACQPHGPLSSMKWFQFTIFNHDFLLAAMILSLDIMHMRRGTESSVSECGITENEKMDLLAGSRELWANVVDECRDARRSVRILDAVIKKVNDQITPKKAMDIRTLTTSTYPPPTSFAGPTVDPTLDIQGYEFGTQDNLSDVLGSDLSIPKNFNWDAWDHFILTQPQQVGVIVSPEFQIPMQPM